MTGPLTPRERDELRRLREVQGQRNLRRELNVRRSNESYAGFGTFWLRVVVVLLFLFWPLSCDRDVDGDPTSGTWTALGVWLGISVGIPALILAVVGVFRLSQLMRQRRKHP